MLKLQVKKAFHDWRDNILRQTGEVIEMTQVRYDELAQNLAEQGIDANDIVEIVKEPKNKEAPVK
mgnify:FL=1